VTAFAPFFPRVLNYKWYLKNHFMLVLLLYFLCLSIWGWQDIFLNAFESVSYALGLHLYNQKYSKSSNIIKYYKFK